MVGPNTNTSGTVKMLTMLKMLMFQEIRQILCSIYIDRERETQYYMYLCRNEEIYIYIYIYIDL